MKKIGIIILNWNGIQDTIECINSLLNNSYKDIDIILIDNNSKNNEGNILKEKYNNKIIFIQNSKNLGFSGGCNVGIKKALELGNEYIMFFNNDAVAKDGFIEKLLEGYNDYNKIGIIGPAITYYKSNRIWFAGGNINYLIGASIHKFKGKDKKILDGLEKYETQYVSGCCILIKKVVIEKVGMLDEKYFAYNEEVDFCFRARKKGYKCIIEPKSIIEHKKSASAGNKGSNYFSEIQAYLIARNGIYFGKKNLYGLKKYWFLFTQYTILPILRIIFQIRNISVLKAYFKGLFNKKCEKIKL